MSTIVHCPPAIAHTETTNVPKTKPDHPKKNAKKTPPSNATSPPKPVNRQPNNVVLKPKSEAGSPYKTCVPILAKPPNTNQVPIASISSKPIASKKNLSPIVKTSNKQHAAAKQAAAHTQPQQPQQILNPNQQIQQPRIIFNGSLQSILAAVGQNPQGLNQQQLAQQLAQVAKSQQTQPQPQVQPQQHNGMNQQFYQQQHSLPLPIAPKPPQTQASMISPTTNKTLPNNSSYHNNTEGVVPPPPTGQIFTATTNADGQIVFQTVGNNQQHNQQNNQQYQHFMQQNLINMMQQQQQQQHTQKTPMINGGGQQQPIFFGQNQLNQLMQQQYQQQQHQTQQQHMLTQPVAASTPTPQDEYTLRQKLLQEEQKFQQLQQQLKNKNELPTNNTPISTQQVLPIHPVINRAIVAIKPRITEDNNVSVSNNVMNQSLPMEKMDVSMDDAANNVLNTSDPNDKRRGRPRLYVKNPLTGKSIKGKRLDGSTIMRVSNKPKTAKISVPGAKKLLIKSLNKVTAKGINPLISTNDTNGVFPSPSTSIASSADIIAKNNATEGSESSSSGSEMDTDVSGNEKTALKPVEIIVAEQPKVLTHVIEGFLIKESSTPFDPKQPTKEVFTCTECKSNKELSEAVDELFCTDACSKRHAKKLIKKQLKKKTTPNPEISSVNDSQTNNRKENSNDLSKEAITHSLKTSQLEDSTNKSKCKSKSHHGHKHHRHRHGHGTSSSSSSSRDKIRVHKKFKHSNPDSIEGPNAALLLPPIAAFSTVSISPQQQSQKLTYQVPVNQINNTFSASLLNNSYNSTSGDQQLPGGDPCEWSCEEVFEFVRIVAGINVAQVFRVQEVDGSALSLIRDDHLVNTMQIKLGPSLKIMSKFNELKTKVVNKVF